MATPAHKIIADDDATLVYTINQVIKRDPPISIVIPNSISLSNLRSQGEINIPAGNQAYDITLTARLGAANYTALITAMETLESTIAVNTHYYLKYDSTLINDGDLISIKVIRLQPIQFDTERSNLRTFIYYNLVLRANSWN